MVEEEDPSPVEVNGDEDEDAKGKRKCISDVCDHFKRKKVNGKFKSQWNHCHKYFLCDPKQGTSHLCGHIGRCPRLKFKDIGDMQQQLYLWSEIKG